MTRTIRFATGYLGRTVAMVRAWLEPPLTADARPLEVKEAILDRVTRETQAAPDGRRVLPHNHVTLTVLAGSKADRLSLGGALDGIEGAIRSRLTELRCALPSAFTVDVQYTRKAKPGWRAGDRFAVELTSRSVTRAHRPGGPPPPGLRLEVLRGRATRRSYSLTERRILVGRTALPTDQLGRPRQNHVIFLEDGDTHSATVGRAHASIAYDPARCEYRLFDDGSHNGTRVVRGGLTIGVTPRDPRGVTLLSGDELQFGTAAVRIEIAS